MNTEFTIDDFANDYVYLFDTYEVGFLSDGINYILCENGYFEFSGIENFKNENGNIYIKNDDEIFFIAQDDFEKIKELIQYHNGNSRK